MINFNKLEVKLTDQLCDMSDYFDGLRNNIPDCLTQIIKIPQDINVSLLDKYIKSLDTTYILPTDDILNDTLDIVEYYQLNNIILELEYQKQSEYDERFDVINKDITIIECTTDTIVDIPPNTNYFSCYHCTSVTGFIGSAKTMIFDWTSLSGEINIPENCTEKFSCNGCDNVISFIGSSKTMMFEWTSLSGIIDIPEGCTKLFLCSGCNNVIGFTGSPEMTSISWTLFQMGSAKTMFIDFASMPFEINIPVERPILLSSIFGNDISDIPTDWSFTFGDGGI